MNAGSTNPICPGATLHFARTADAFDAERNRQKMRRSQLQSCPNVLRASASPAHKLTAPEDAPITTWSNDKLLNNPCFTCEMVAGGSTCSDPASDSAAIGSEFR